MTAVMERRDFLRTGAAVGGGLLISLCLPELAQAGSADVTRTTPTVFTPNAFIRIGADDSVTIIVGKAEMGQGVLVASIATRRETSHARAMTGAYTFKMSAEDRMVKASLDRSAAPVIRNITLPD